MNQEQTIDGLLADYDELTDCLSDLLRREHAHLKEGRTLEETMEEKKALLEEITELNTKLRAYGKERNQFNTVQRTRVEALQNKFMLILKQDRAVEKAYLSLSAGAPPEFKPVASRVGKAYGKQANLGG